MKAKAHKKMAKSHITQAIAILGQKRVLLETCTILEHELSYEPDKVMARDVESFIDRVREISHDLPEHVHVLDSRHQDTGLEALEKAFYDTDPGGARECVKAVIASLRHAGECSTECASLERAVNDFTRAYDACLEREENA